MEREDIPEEDRAPQVPEDLPGHRRGALGHRRPPGGPRERQLPVEAGMRGEVGLVRERQARAPPAAIPEVARYPDRIDASREGRLRNEPQVLPPDLRGVGPVVIRTGLGVGVKRVTEAKRRQGIDEGGRCHVGRFATAGRAGASWGDRRTACLTASRFADRYRTCGGFVIPAAQALLVNRAEAALPPTLSETVATTWPLAATGSLPCTLLEPAGLRSIL